MFDLFLSLGHRIKSINSFKMNIEECAKNHYTGPMNPVEFR